LKDIVDGKHLFFSEKLAKAELPMILIGAPTLERSDGEALMN
jgi:hypothetical protein